MSISILATAKVTFDAESRIKSVNDFSYPNTTYFKNSSLENALKSHLNDTLANTITSLIDKGIIIDQKCYVQVLDNERVILISDIASSEAKTKDITEHLTAPIKEAVARSADKISNHCLWILDKTKSKSKSQKSNKTTTAKSSSSIEEKSKNILETAFKSFLSGLDFIFVKKLYHAKAADIAQLSLFTFTILVTAITLFAPHLSFLHFAAIGTNYSLPIFGSLNISVGLSIFVQAAKNFAKAKKNQNNEEMILALVSMLFSFAIMTTGITAIAHFSSDFVFTMLLTICAGFSFGVGTYNTIKTQMFRKKLNDAKNLKEFLKEQLEINKDEYEDIKKKTEALKDEKAIELEKLLKKYLSTKDFDEINGKTIDDKKNLLFNLELGILQRKKIANVEKLLRNKLTKRAIDFINGAEDLSLEEDIRKELFYRNIADGLRIIATSLSIGAFAFKSLSTIDNKNTLKLIYYSMMLISKLSGFWQNYVPSWRNVPADEKKDIKKPKTILEHMAKRAEKLQAVAPEPLPITP
ncbi:MAG: hypothetical protein K1060chlam1_00281 [Candidatus Anoxychlamydiales bacterium]|nr:hypothetical protein [Candidatus Anoxychlamydiales bacterium]